MRAPRRVILTRERGSEGGHIHARSSTNERNANRRSTRSVHSPPSPNSIRKAVELRHDSKEFVFEVTAATMPAGKWSLAHLRVSCRLDRPQLRQYSKSEEGRQADIHPVRLGTGRTRMIIRILDIHYLNKSCATICCCCILSWA